MYRTSPSAARVLSDDCMDTAVFVALLRGLQRVRVLSGRHVFSNFPTITVQTACQPLQVRAREQQLGYSLCLMHSIVHASYIPHTYPLLRALPLPDNSSTTTPVSSLASVLLDAGKAPAWSPLRLLATSLRCDMRLMARLAHRHFCNHV